MPKREPIAVVVLAAGKGTRMRSDFPKVLHKAAGRTLLGHVLHSAAEAKPERTVVISGPEMPEVGEEARSIVPEAAIAIQEKRQGTGHAVGIAKDGLKGFEGTVLVLYGDVPLISAETISALAQAVSEESPLAVLGFRAANPTGYGRLIQNRAGKLIAIREELDTTVDERRIDLCNSGFIGIKAKLLWELLPRITNDNAKHEYYLTDLVGLTVGQGRQVALALAGRSVTRHARVGHAGGGGRREPSQAAERSPHGQNGGGDPLDAAGKSGGGHVHSSWDDAAGRQGDTPP